MNNNKLNAGKDIKLAAKLNEIISDVISRGNSISIEIATDDQEQYGKNLMKRIQELNLLDLDVDEELKKFLMDSAAVSIIMMFHMKSAEENKPKMDVVKEPEPQQEEKKEYMRAELNISYANLEQVKVICLNTEGIFECVRSLDIGNNTYTLYTSLPSTRKRLEEFLRCEIKWITNQQ